MIPADVPLIARRNARFGEEFPFEIEGAPVDLTGWSAKLQVRQYGAQAGTALIALANVAGDVEGVWIVEPSEGILRVRIDEDTLAGVYDDLIGANEAGSSIALVYDLRLLAPAGGDEVWAEGSFTIEPGVTVDA